MDEAQVRQCVDDHVLALLASHPEIEEIVVFGSFVTGTFAPGSDVDLFILLSDCDKPVRERVPDFLPSSFPVSLDVFPYTLAEVAVLEDSPLIKAMRNSPSRYRRMLRV